MTKRCLIVLIASASLFFACNKTPDKSIKVHRILKNLSPTEQVYKINPEVANTITAKNGTKLFIPARAFNLNIVSDEDSMVTICITEIMEKFDFATVDVDMVYYDHNGKEQMFESAGMIGITAKHQNKELELTDKKKS
ncbi:MAG: hypothetical protein ACRCUT_00435 [Spirochaetota bacterium]